MNNRLLPKALLTLALPLLGGLPVSVRAQQAPTPNLETLFQNPPEAARPWVFWYWMNGAVTPEGITADLAAMKEAGIGGAYLMPIKDVENPPAITPPARQLSPQWWKMVKHAMTEADRLGLKLAMHVSDGFALAGGPWITPELSMQKLTYSETQTTGGKRLSLTLLQPPAVQGYYRDVAVYAYPTPSSTASTYTTKPKVTSNIPDSQPALLAVAGNKETLKSNEPGWVQYAFDQPFTCRSIRVRSKGYNYQANRLRVEASDDGRTFRPVMQLRPPRSGWQDSSAVTHALPATTARYFRFVYDPAGSEPGAEDLDAAKWKQSLKVTEIRLSSEARINQFEGKNGEVWRVSERTTAQQVPAADCVPLNKVLNLTDKLDATGRLTWQAPPGRWTILRMGHTSTGQINTTGGGARGLECDKFNPEAVKLQFDSWFGEAVRQAGPELAGRVLKMFHVDSWECGSQNWSRNFAAEFRQRRGYDLLPYLPVMAGVPLQSADQSERVLFDVRQTIAELVNDKFYVTLKEQAHAKGCTFSAEAIAPTMVSDGLLHYQHADVPMGEFWLRSPTHDKPNDMLDAISGAHIYGKNIVQAEAFTELRLAWDEHPGMLKALQDRNYALGVNRMVYHVFVHNPWLDRQPGMTLSGIGLFFQRDQTWWKPGRAWVDYARRCQALLQLGHPVADVAVFTGEETPRRAILPDRLVATLPGIFGPQAVANEKKRFANVGLPMREQPEKVSASANMYTADELVDPLHGYAYDSFNKDALLRLAKVENGRIVLPGGASYGLLVVPGAHPLWPNSTSMSPEVAAKLRELAQAGATILLDREPARSPSLQKFPAADNEVQQVASDFQQLSTKSTTSSGSPSPRERGPGGEANRQNGPQVTAATTAATASAATGRVLQGPYTAPTFEPLGLPRDVVATTHDGRPARGIAWNHRTAPEFDIYFISNQLDSVQMIDLSLRVSGRQPELWDAVTGEMQPARNWFSAEGRTRLPLYLERNASVFVVLREPTTQTAASAGMNWHKLLPVQMLAGPWQVRFDPEMHGPTQPVAFPTLTDWSQHPNDSIRHYAGTAEYSQTFRWQPSKQLRKQLKQQDKTPVYLELNTVANLAEVTLNGQPIGTAWTAPYRLDITKALRRGDNQLSIRVTNTWANRLIGEQAKPADQRRVWTPAPLPAANKPLLPAGLLGPVNISLSNDYR
ncbi:discoidin domain-containing protein [Hymenobacter aerilatus]|uniref:Discoidin domain-containing protein n=1 Tax=Hymenobacter aerilatus TaxID=2932251 RepID=A0A8T9SN74_9BACT|nr:glycosyl hydrolase [Hymenobacter aerilatus]UOR03548.1 discoidin domain-containing protein [Hymenobacter aerilatus]